MRLATQRGVRVPAARETIVIYQAYGKPSVHEQVAYSLASLNAHRRRAPIRPVVYTDQVGRYERLGAEAILLTPTTIALWKGPLGFIHRVKIEIILDALARYRTDVLYLDADTFWYRGPERLLSQLAAGHCLTHESEGRIGEGEHHDWLRRFLTRTYRGELAPLSHPVPPDVVMRNAGVLGIPYQHRTSVFEVLALTDELLLRCYQTEWLEQLAFSYILAEATSVATAEHEVVHYWRDKFLADATAKHLLSGGTTRHQRPLRTEPIDRLRRELALPGEGHWAKTKRKTLRSLRKRVSWLHAKRLRRRGYLQSAAYRVHMRKLREALVTEHGPDVHTRVRSIR